MYMCFAVLKMGSFFSLVPKHLATRSVVEFITKYIYSHEERSKLSDLCSIHTLDWRDPFNLQKGWLLWAGIGLGGALAAIAATGAVMSFFNGEPPQREVRI